MFSHQRFQSELYFHPKLAYRTSFPSFDALTAVIFLPQSSGTIFDKNMVILVV